jgi:hypothetical protein
MLTITFPWNMDSALQLFWHGRRSVFFFLLFDFFASEHGYWFFFGFSRVNASLGGTHCETFQKNDT